MDIILNHVADFYNYLKNVLSSDNLRSSRDAVFTQFGFYFTLYLMFCYLMYVVSSVFRNHLAKSKYFDKDAKRIMLVIAHPDDECMFFGPLIVGLQRKQGYIIYLMCLSNGDADKKGNLRKRELYESCKVLGIPYDNILLCCSSLRKDGHQYKWKSDIIATLIHDYVESYEIDTVVTFDKYGVSGHENHIALFRAVSYLCLRNWLPEYCRVFVLDSLGIVRKYTSLMDSVWSILSADNVFILSPYEHKRVKHAMAMHKTQFVWYRKLYMNFSRYTYINTFCELTRFQEVNVSTTS